jgi:hypothetical protein
MSCVATANSIVGRIAQISTMIAETVTAAIQTFLGGRK